LVTLQAYINARNCALFVAEAVIGNTTTAGGVSDYYLTNFENMEWIQIRAELSSTATTPSYVPLLEIRIR